MDAYIVLSPKCGIKWLFVHVCPEMLVNNYQSKQHNIPKIVTNRSKKMAKFKNLGMTLSNQNCRAD
jgi:hypothetical protein